MLNAVIWLSDDPSILLSLASCEKFAPIICTAENKAVERLDKQASARRPPNDSESSRLNVIGLWRLVTAVLPLVSYSHHDEYLFRPI